MDTLSSQEVALKTAKDLASIQKEIAEKDRQFQDEKDSLRAALSDAKDKVVFRIILMTR